MAKIIINRKGEWMNRLRGIKVFIDGKQVGSVKNDSSEEFTVPAGSHTVECRVDWCASQPVSLDLGENEVKVLKLQNGMRYYWAVYILAVVFLVTTFTMQDDLPAWVQYSTSVMLGVFVLYMVYYLTIGRKHYLSLQVDKDNIFNT